MILRDEKTASINVLPIQALGCLALVLITTNTTLHLALNCGVTELA
jgi:hypothetical protein